jgi:citrate lyase gamma subunit
MTGRDVWATTYESARTWVTRKFLLGDAHALATQLSPADRARLIEQLGDSAEKREGGEILAASDQPALALELAERAVDVLLAALRSPPVAATMDWLGVSDRDRERWQRAGEAAQTPRPAHNRDVTAAHRQRTALALAAARRAERKLSPLVRPVRRIAIQRFLRIAAVAVVAIGAITCIIRARLHSGALSATASVSYDQNIHAPAMAIDGDPATEWLLPSATLGAIEIKLRPRRLHAIHLRNAHNAPYDDRATREFHIEGHRAGKLIHKAKGSFPRLESAPAPTRLPFATPAEIDTLKIVIDGYHKSGGGLAEISWD